MKAKIKLENRITFYFAVLVLFTVLLSNIFLLMAVRSKYAIEEKRKIREIAEEIHERFFSEELEIVIFSGSFSERFAKFLDRMKLEKIFIKVSIDKIVIFDNTWEIKEAVESKYENSLFGDNEHFRFYEKYIAFSIQDRVLSHIIETAIVKDVRVERNMINQFIENNIYVSLIGIALAALLGKLTASRIVKPINRIIKTAEMIDLKKPGIRIIFDKPDYEIGVLINVLNSMIGRIETSYIAQSRFVEDASHELRTPLQIMRGYIEIMDSWGKESKEMTEEAVKNIKEEIHNTIHLVERLLFIARGDKGNIPVKMEEISISDFIYKIIAEMEMTTEKNTFKFSNKEDFDVLADKELLRQALRALLENGIKYSYENTNITISTHKDEKNWSVKILDEGIGIEEKDIKKVFDRFYRADNSRTKDTGGTGLGLAIVMTIMKLHNGNIDIKSEYGKWTEVSLIFPVV